MLAGPAGAARRAVRRVAVATMINFFFGVFLFIVLVLLLLFQHCILSNASQLLRLARRARERVDAKTRRLWTLTHRYTYG